MIGAWKNPRDKRVSVSVEELVPPEHFLRAAYFFVFPFAPFLACFKKFLF